MFSDPGISDAVMRDVVGCFGRALPGARLPGFASGTRISNPIASRPRRRQALLGAQLPEQTPKDDLHTHGRCAPHASRSLSPVRGVEHLDVNNSPLDTPPEGALQAVGVCCGQSAYTHRCVLSWHLFSVVVFLFALRSATRMTLSLTHAF